MIHSCINVDIENNFPVLVKIQQPCCNQVSICEKFYCCEINIDNPVIACHIYESSNYSINIEDKSTITIMLEWVCSTGYVEKYLTVTPTDIQWVTVEYDTEYYVRSNTNWIIR